MRLHVAERLTVMRAGDSGDEPNLRVTEKDSRKLAARISSDADDRGSDRHQPIMRRNAYLCKQL
jgi:hypothetical protein